MKEKSSKVEEGLAFFAILLVAVLLFLPLYQKQIFEEEEEAILPVSVFTNSESYVEKDYIYHHDVSVLVKEYIEKHTPRFVFPLDGVITSAFSYRVDPILLDREEYHLGIDISAKDDIEISSYSDGTVKKTVISDKDYGIYLVIEHDGFETLYAHCSKLLVEEGEKVKAGDVIAIAGSTGRSTGVHLHFEVKENGKRIDPLLHMEQNGVKRYA